MGMSKAKYIFFFQVYLWVLVLYFHFVGAMAFVIQRKGWLWRVMSATFLFFIFIYLFIYIYSTFLSLKGSSLRGYFTTQHMEISLLYDFLFLRQKENDKYSLMFSFGAQLHTMILLFFLSCYRVVD
jgi:hypothetical protein